MERKKLFFLTHLLPYPFDMGNKIRMFNILKSLSVYFDITLVSQVSRKDDLVYVDRFREFCSDTCVIVADNHRSLFRKVVRWGSYRIMHAALGTPHDLYYANYCGLKAAATALLRERRYDVSFFEYWFWPDLTRIATGLKVVDTNDVQCERNEQLLPEDNRGFLENRAMAVYRRMEMQTLRSFDLVVTVTERDAMTLNGMLGGGQFLTIPTGVNTATFTPREPVVGRGGSVISFYGSMGGPANVEALFYFYKEIFPIVRDEVPDAQLLVIGANPTADVQRLAQSDEAVEVTGFVEDVGDALSKSVVSVCPMQVAYGIRGRVLEVMSLGIPVVVTSVAVEGMGLCDGEGIIVSDGKEEFALEIIRLLRERDKAREIGLRGRDYIERNYSYDATYGRLSKALHEACQVHCGV